MGSRRWRNGRERILKRSPALNPKKQMIPAREPQAAFPFFSWHGLLRNLRYVGGSFVPCPEWYDLDTPGGGKENSEN